MSKITYSIVVPAYNEEKRIGKTLSFYGQYLEQNFSGKYELIVVLNGCRDNTLGVAKQKAREFTGLKILEYPEAIGKGGAIRQGFWHAQGGFVGYVDADCSTEPAELMRLFGLLKKNPAFDSVIASRRLPHSKVSAKSLQRKCMSMVFNWTVNTLFNLKIADTQCGAKVFTRKSIQAIHPHLLITNLAVDVDILTEMKRQRLPVMESPTVWQDAENSTISRPLKTSMVMFGTLVKMRLLKSKLNFLVSTLDTSYNLALNSSRNNKSV